MAMSDTEEQIDVKLKERVGVKETNVKREREKKRERESVCKICHDTINRHMVKLLLLKLLVSHDVRGFK